MSYDALMSDAADNHRHLIVLPTGKTHVSVSEARMWAECSWRHDLAQVKKINEQRPSPVPTFGTAMHAMQEAFLRTRCIDPTIAHCEIDILWDRCGFSLPEPSETIDPLDAFLSRTGLTLVEARERFGFDTKSRLKAHSDVEPIANDVPSFMDVEFPDWKFISAELQLYEPIAETGVAFKGFIDGVITTTGKRGELLTWIIDWKTSAWGWNREKRADPLIIAQLVLYKKFWLQRATAFLNEDVPKLRDVRCGFVLLKRSAKPKQHCELVPVSVGDVSIERAMKIIGNMIASVKRGIKIKNRLSCTYCEFKNTAHCV